MERHWHPYFWEKHFYVRAPFSEVNCLLFQVCFASSSLKPSNPLSSSWSQPQTAFKICRNTLKWQHLVNKRGHEREGGLFGEFMTRIMKNDILLSNRFVVFLFDYRESKQKSYRSLFYCSSKESTEHEYPSLDSVSLDPIDSCRSRDLNRSPAS